MKPYRTLFIVFALAKSLLGFGPQAPPAESSTQEVVGTLRDAKGAELTIQTSDGQTVHVDATVAIREHHSAPLVIGHAISARGTYDKKGILHANPILRAKESSGAAPSKQ
jgi:hypothetical protein